MENKFAPPTAEELQAIASVGQPGTTEPAIAPPSQEELAMVQKMSQLPSYANGLSAHAPINESPLTIHERYDIFGAGNKEGAQAKLQERFGKEGVTQDSEGNLVVKSNGAWHRVDADNFGDVDPIKATAGIIKAALGIGVGLTAEGVARAVSNKAGDYIAKKNNEFLSSNPVSKELASEYAENSPMIANLLSQAVPGLKGLSVLNRARVLASTGAGLELARTSWGRLQGTYKADPMQQIDDVGTELVLNALGVFVPAAVFPDKAIGKQLVANADEIAKIPVESKQALKSFYSKLGGTKYESVNELLDGGAKEIGELVKKVTTETADPVKQTRAYRQIGINAIKDIADDSEKLLKNSYQESSRNLLKAVPENFRAPISQPLAPVYEDALAKGFVRFTENGKQLPMSDALELMAKTKGELPETIAMKVKPYAEYVKDAQNAGDVPLSKKAYSYVSEFFSEANSLSKVKTLEGKSGALKLLESNRRLDDLTRRLGAEAKEVKANEIYTMLSQYHEQIKGGVNQAFDQRVGKGLFSNMQQEYATIKNGLGELLDARTKAIKDGSDVAYEQLLGKVSARASNTVVQTEFGQAVKLAEKYSPEIARKIGESQRQIRIASAAQDFTPWTKPGSMSQGYGIYGTTKLGQGDATPLSVGAVVAMAQSPRLSMKAAQMTDALWKGRDFMNKLGPMGAKQMVYTPRLLNNFLESMAEAPVQAEQVSQQLMQPVQQQRQQRGF